MQHTPEEIFSRAPVIPVITINDLNDAVPLAFALKEGGLPVLEITLRTPQGLEAIRRVVDDVDDVVVGAGTVLNTEDLARAIDAGSEFIITPGITPALLEKGVNCGLPFMPGIATVSEAMLCRDAGLNALKFFPAEASGGAQALKAFAGPLPGMGFCPTGGIGPVNLADYLRLSSVKTVGGSWMIPADLLAAKNWSEITALAKNACELANSIQAN